MSDTEERPPVRELSAAQRRVLGVLLEKAFTTPEYYPLTLKAVITGCNQKSNRSPIVNYDEDRAEDILDELRELGLAAVIEPATGRSLRYRHYMRHVYSFTEPQLAILTELLLRGRQTLGELRSRASRMVSIDSLQTLRDELSGLVSEGYVRSSGSLERRGVEVDHGFYLATESRGLEPMPVADTEPDVSSAPAAPARAASPAPVPNAGLAELKAENQQLRADLEALQNAVSALEGRFDDLCRELGVSS